MLPMSPCPGDTYDVIVYSRGQLPARPPPVQENLVPRQIRASLLSHGPPYRRQPSLSQPFAHGCSCLGPRFAIRSLRPESVHVIIALFLTCIVQRAPRTSCRPRHRPTFAAEASLAGCNHPGGAFKGRGGVRGEFPVRSRGHGTRPRLSSRRVHCADGLPLACSTSPCPCQSTWCHPNDLSEALSRLGLLAARCTCDWLSGGFVYLLPTTA
ncbi:hypothetical protein LX36DRAFT_419175 [Colletotrichum falcatum]|nr:hypothetical protein LX36DRAFT_419175 [Colletotrichum falcatum]